MGINIVDGGTARPESRRASSHRKKSPVAIGIRLGHVIPIRGNSKPHNFSVNLWRLASEPNPKTPGLVLQPLHPVRTRRDLDQRA